MVKRKRASIVEAEPASKVQRFVNKLAKSLFDTARGPLQDDTVAAAFKEAIAKLPEGNLVRQKLQQGLHENTQLLLQKLAAIQAQPVTSDSPTPNQEPAPALSSPGARCLSELCHRSCQTDQDKIGRCQHILAACVNVIPSGVIQREPGLSVCLDAIRSTLQDICNASNDSESTAAKADSLRPLIAQLKCVVMLSQMRKGNLSEQAYVSADELQQTGAETVLLAAEQRILADQHVDPRAQVLLAASDMHNLIGDQSDTILQLLLQDSLPCISLSDSKTAGTLWEILYKATLQQSRLRHTDAGFLLRIAATQKARTVLPVSQHHGLADLNSMPAPAAFIAWLQRQPRSQTVQQYLDALQQSPLQLTQHLLESNKVNVLLALQYSRDTVTLQAADDGQSGPLASDEGLFYLDEAGDFAFGRRWDNGAADAEQQGGSPKNSLQIDDLPDSSKPEVTESSDESD